MKESEDFYLERALSRYPNTRGKGKDVLEKKRRTWMLQRVKAPNILISG